MFRRNDDGSEKLVNETTATQEGAKLIPAGAASPTPATPSAPVAAPATATAPSAPTMATAPTQPATPSFRPAPPQAAMVAANRNPTPAAPQQPPLAPAPTAPSMAEPTRSAAVPSARPNAKRILTVGPDIQMKGEIASCDRVVIEGMVDATMRDVHTVELSQTGSLKGTAEVEDAEISGAFEGDLIVRGKLTVYTSGRLRGNVTYGEIEIQCGGQISGNIRNLTDSKLEGSATEKRAA